jgi:hypothetical protein
MHFAILSELAAQWLILADLRGQEDTPYADQRGP